MSKIMIIGCGGAGKSIFSIKLHEITKIKLIHLDRQFWKPNWVETEKGAWKEKVKMLSNESSWIIDGNYGGTMDIRLEKANTIIFLDRSKWLCLYRVIRRVIMSYGKTRRDMGEGCEERFSWGFLKYVYHYNETRRPKILNSLERHRLKKEVIILSSGREVVNYLREMRKNSS